MENKKIDEILNRFIYNNSNMSKIYGKDEYYDNNCEYAECYAKLVNALFYIFKKTGDLSLKESAFYYINLMCSLKNENKFNVWWGLPFDWGNTKTNDGFLITTCFCIETLNSFSKEGYTKFDSVIKKAINWCFSLLNKDTDLEENAFFYSPKLKINIYNATSIACGTLLECDSFLEQMDKEKLYSVMEGLIKAQKSQGYWTYSKNKYDVDLLHQCYTIEGILRGLPYLPRELQNKAFISAKSGIDFIIKRMSFSDTERYLFMLNDDEKLNVRMKHILLRTYKMVINDKKHFSSPRCWSYAAYIRILYYFYYISKEKSYIDEAYRVIGFVNDNLISKNRIQYKIDDKREFIRHKYHMVEALALIKSGDI